MKWLRRILKITPRYQPPKGFEDAYKSAVKRINSLKNVGKEDPLIESCGKTVADIIISNDYIKKASVAKIYFEDGTVLVIESTIGTTYNQNPCVETMSKLNNYSLTHEEFKGYVYREVEA